MKHKQPRSEARFATWLIAALTCAATLHAADRKPNFLFIYTDDHRWDAMGVVQREQGEQARFPWFKSPGMDRLAAEGVRFRNAFVTLSLCAPSRAAFLTGRYNHLNGITDNGTPFPADAVTHASLLRAAGYRTAYIGKWHMGNQRGQRPGFDYSASIIGQGRYQDCPVEINGVSTPTKGWLDDVSTDFAIEWMKQNRAHPFSMVVGFKSPHSPRGGKNLPERLRNIYAGETSRPTPNCSVPAIFHKPDPKTGKLPAGLADNAVHLDYLCHVAGVDENIGRLLDALNELGLAEDTVVVYTSDNGYYLGEHCAGDKRSLYEESLRVPMLVRSPRLFGKGRVADEMVLNIDLAPTFLDLAGVPVPKEMQGASWKGLAAGRKPANWRQSFFAQYYKELGDVPTLYAVRTTTHKLVKYPNRPEWTEVFDLTTDPYEINNLASDAALTARLEAELNSLVKAVNYTVPENANKPRETAASPEAGGVFPRETRDISGWQVHIQKKLLGTERDDTEHALGLLKKMLDDIVRVVPAVAVVELRKVPLYFSPAYKPGRSGAEFHPDAGWLRDNGRDPSMARGIEFSGVADFEAEMNRMPNFALHELAHAYHFRVLRDGFGNVEIKAAYERAKAGGKYERVERWHGNGKPNTFERAYAMTDPMEYFAETTEAFFVRNDFFPFTREELKQHDPEMLALLEKLWGAAPGALQSNDAEPAATSRATAPKSPNTDKLRDLTAKAEKGDAAAQLALALRYRDGKDVKRDYAEAMRWAHLAADRGDAAAMDFVGWMFFNGLGVKHNPTIAAGYFKAAAGESATAAWNLGQCYFGAQGVDQDIPKALEAWKKAAAMGHGRAASTAAMACLAGDGIAPDAAEARKLATRAAALNDPNGLVVLGEIHYQAGEIEPARASWTKVSKLKPVGLTGHPEQPGDQVAAQQGADLLKLMDYRRRKPEPGKFALVPVPHLHQGWNNCGATSCAMLARAQGKKLGAWDYKRLCPSPLGTGTDWGDLLKAAEKIGLHWKLVTFTPDDAGFDKATAFVRTELDVGRPVVIDFKFTGPDYPDGEAGHTLAIAGYLAEENLYILCNPAIASPGLQFITAADLKHFWCSDHYGELSNNVLSRPAIVIDTP